MALAISLPHLALAATGKASKPVACGNNFNCLIKRASACAPATGRTTKIIKISKDKQPPEFSQKFTYEYTIKGWRENRCLFNRKLIASKYYLTDKQRQNLILEIKKAAPKQTEGIKEQLPEINRQILDLRKGVLEVTDKLLADLNSISKEMIAGLPEGESCTADNKPHLVKFVRTSAVIDLTWLKNSPCTEKEPGIETCAYAPGISCQRKKFE